MSTGGAPSNSTDPSALIVCVSAGTTLMSVPARSSAVSTEFSSSARCASAIPRASFVTMSGSGTSRSSCPTLAILVPPAPQGQGVRQPLRASGRPRVVEPDQLREAREPLGVDRDRAGELQARMPAEARAGGEREDREHAPGVREPGDHGAAGRADDRVGRLVAADDEEEGTPLERQRHAGAEGPSRRGEPARLAAVTIRRAYCQGSPLRYAPRRSHLKGRLSSPLGGALQADVVRTDGHAREVA